MLASFLVAHPGLIDPDYLKVKFKPKGFRSSGKVDADISPCQSSGHGA